ncbi:MAG: hypothetical protein H6R04_197 [Burkholderiaceae bacterium]|nr:hypothetical protein [Burkholderiaceae bacterium]
MDDDTEDRGRILLPIARSSISAALGQPADADESAPWLTEPGACFVTLRKNQQLRGCIGTLEAYRPLLLDVKANAQAAALRDPRFSPLKQAEFSQIQIEVSLLTPKEPLQFTSEAHALEQLQPEVDGVIIEYGRHRSTFLPQVWEQLPSAAEFMKHLKQKAGLPGDFWSEELAIYRYRVSKWAEKYDAKCDERGKE